MVIVVIGILSVIVIPNISSFKDEAKETAMVADGKNLQTAVDMYQLDNHGDFPTLQSEGEEGNSKPILGEPKGVDFTLLYPDYIRDLPQHQGMYYWIDYQGKVYQSTIDNPNDFKQDDSGLSWTADERAAGYNVYEVESSNTSAAKKSIVHTIGKLDGSTSTFVPDEYTKEKTYLISATDAYGQSTAPVKKNYAGIAPFEANGSVGPLTPEQEELIEDPTNIKVATGYHFTLVLKSNGELWGFGSNYAGQLMQATMNSTLSTPKMLMTGVKSIGAGGNHTLIIKDNNELWSVGRNNNGELGYADHVGTYNFNNVLRKVMSDVKSVEAGDAHTLAVKTNGELWSFGRNDRGQLGHSTTSNTNYTPRMVLTNVEIIETSDNHSLALKTNGDLWSFGANDSGQLGYTQNTNANYAPKHILSYIKSMSAGQSYSLVVNSNDELWSFGNNRYGGLGHSGNFGTNFASPTPRKIMNNVQSVSAAYHSLVVKTNGELWSFGHNNFGELGHLETTGTEKAYPIPTLIASGVHSANAGNFSSFFVKTNGSIWSFGTNGNGKLGYPHDSGTSDPNPTARQIQFESN